jgi:hypothetical protein
MEKPFTAETTAAEIRGILSSILSVPVESINPADSIWAKFPKSHPWKKSPEALTFRLAISKEYTVYLGEEEWKNPSILQLAHIIQAKKADPQSMLAYIQKIYEGGRKWLFIWIIISCILTLAPFVVFDADFKSRLGLAGWIFIISFSAGAILFRQAHKRFMRDTAPVRQHYQLKIIT